MIKKLKFTRVKRFTNKEAREVFTDIINRHGLLVIDDLSDDEFAIVRTKEFRKMKMEIEILKNALYEKEYE